MSLQPLVFNHDYGIGSLIADVARYAHGHGKQCLKKYPDISPIIRSEFIAIENVVLKHAKKRSLTVKHLPFRESIAMYYENILMISCTHDSL